MGIQQSKGSVYGAQPSAQFIEKNMNVPVDQQFYSRFTDANGSQQTLTSVILTNAGLTCAIGQQTVAVYSKQTYNYPYVSGKFQHADWTGISEGINRDMYVGLENGGSNGNGIISWLLNRSATNVDHYYIKVQRPYSSISMLLEVTSLLATVKTASHNYHIKVMKHMALFYQDSTLIAIVCFVPSLALNNSGVVTGTAPYAIACVDMDISTSLQALYEINMGAVATAAVTEALTADNWRITDGKDNSVLDLPLYKTGTSTKWAGSSQATAGNTDSNLFPIVGFSARTLRILSDQVVTIAVSVMDLGGTMRQVSSTALVANTVTDIAIPDGIIAKINIANASGSTANISTCEVICRP